MYAEAKDEFEIATESTDANAVYAQSDREAARDELEKLKKAWEEIQGEVKEELVQRGLGGRIRELEAAVEDLERRGLEH